MTRLTILAGLDSFRGYGLHAIEIARGLIRRGIYPSIRTIKMNDGVFGAGIPSDVRQLVVTGPQPELWELLLAPPHHVPTPGKKTLYFTMWESTVLPGRSVDLLNLSEAVIVPSKWCAENFQRSGVRKPIYVVPLGIDPSVFNPSLFHRSGPTVFACAGRTAHGRERKGLDGAIRAFIAAFPYDKDVRLRVKCHEDCTLPESNDSRIEVVRGHLPAHEVARFLSSSHCFVSAACAEGWGLWQQQAMAMGRPIIAAIYGGLQEFAGNENSYPMKYRIGDSSEHFGGQWAIPDLGDMIEQMRHVHRNREECEAVGKLAAQSAGAFTWNRANDELVSVLGQVGFTKPVRRVYFRPSLSHEGNEMRSAPSVITQARARGWEVDEFNFLLREDEAVFNPSLAGDTWFFRRSKTTGGNRDGSIIFTSTGKHIKLPGFEGDWFEDPRALVDGDGFVLSYTRVSKGCFPTQEIAFLDKDFNVKDVWHPNIGGNGTSPSTATKAEKNWAWFKHEGEWHMIHWIEPFEVRRVTSGLSDWKYWNPAYNPKWRFGVKHGGAHPTQIGNEYFGFCHSLLPWYSKNRSRYFISAYAFEAQPPFRMTRLAREPLLRSEDDWRTNPCSCCIAGGAVFKDDVWTLAVGARDEQALSIKIPHGDVLATMDNV